MRFGLDVAQHQLEWPELLQRVRFAEELGFDGAWVFDHFKPLYGDARGPCLEGWTVLAGLAAQTSRIRLGTLVTGITYRHPAVLATEAVTVDQISSGRLELGLGAAWNEAEHTEYGIPFPQIRERAEHLEEGIEVMRMLMTRDAASFKGRHYQLHQATYRPRPIQRPHPPIWIGASGEKLMLPIVARQADAWHAFGSADSMLRKSKLLDEYAEKAGRDRKQILRSSSLSISEGVDQARRKTERLAEAGFGYLVVSWPAEGERKVEEFVKKVVASVGAG
ncbi:MAG TPA: TIGR03560 family F420-dependent LLM class oxidoreductase [Candidatus Dormibacteraeota bacterium]|jgi:F420-dependent oxidoreductase-like protein